MLQGNTLHTSSAKLLRFGFYLELANVINTYVCDFTTDSDAILIRKSAGAAFMV